MNSLGPAILFLLASFIGIFQVWRLSRGPEVNRNAVWGGGVFSVGCVFAAGTLLAGSHPIWLTVVSVVFLTLGGILLLSTRRPSR